jgi:hypothetical protein
LAAAAHIILHLVGLVAAKLVHALLSKQSAELIGAASAHHAVHACAAARAA